VADEKQGESSPTICGSGFSPGGGRGAAFRGSGIKAIDQRITAAMAYSHHMEQGNGKAILVLRVSSRMSSSSSSMRPYSPLLFPTQYVGHIT